MAEQYSEYEIPSPSSPEPRPAFCGSDIGSNYTAPTTAPLPLHDTQAVPFWPDTSPSSRVNTSHDAISLQSLTADSLPWACCKMGQRFPTSTPLGRLDGEVLPIYNLADRSLCQAPMSIEKQHPFEPASSLSFWRPTFCQLEQIPATEPTYNIVQYLSARDSLETQTIDPTQVFTHEIPHLQLADDPPVAAYFDSFSAFLSKGSQGTSCRKNSGLLCCDPRQTYNHVSSEQLGIDTDLEAPQNYMRQYYFKCTESGCRRRFKRQGNLQRHLESHYSDRSYVCWVPECLRAFSRRDNLNAHYRTHGTRKGRNRYVSTLDETSADYNPGYRGRLTPDGLPLYI